MSILNSILSGDFILVDKDLIKRLGSIKAAYFFSFLKEKAQAPTNELINGYFPLTADEVHSELGLTYREQASCIEILKNNNLIEACLLGGLPAKRHFKLTK